MSGDIDNRRGGLRSISEWRSRRWTVALTEIGVAEDAGGDKQSIICLFEVPRCRAGNVSGEKDRIAIVVVCCG